MSINLINSFSDMDKWEKIETPKVIGQFAQGTVGSLFGQGGTGKGFIALAMSFQMATGRQLTHFKSQGLKKVVYLTKEDPLNELRNRVISFREQFGFSEEEIELLNHNFKLGEIEDRSEKTSVTNDEFISELEELANDADMLILDTLSRLHFLDENQAGDMGIVMARLEQLAKKNDCSVLFIHHSRKAGSTDGDGSGQDAIRGSGLLVDNARWAVSVSYVSKKERDRLTTKKVGLTNSDVDRVVVINDSKVNYEAKDGRKKYIRCAKTGILYCLNSEDEKNLIEMLKCTSLISKPSEAGERVKAFESFDEILERDPDWINQNDPVWEKVDEESNGNKNDAEWD